MASSQLFLSVALLLTGHATVAADDQWASTVNEEGKNVQQLKIQAPSMSEEDQYGYNMPDQYRCDSCKVVAYHITEALQRKQPKNRRLQEWEYADLFDETCKTGQETFKGYGISVVDGQNVLSGPALKRTDDVKPGMGAIQMGGETWEKRLSELCRKFVYEKIGEDEVYEHFRSQGEVSSDLCFSETRDCKASKLGPKPPTSEERNTEKKAKKDKKEKADAAAAKAKAAEDIDVTAFVSRLAKKHGLAPILYTKKRSFAEWEQLFVQSAKRIEQVEVEV